MNDVRKMGRVTIPTDTDAVSETLNLLKRWGADAIRDCDGTEFPQELKDTGAKIYATYYTTRKDNAWAKANPDETQQCYIMTPFYTAEGGALTIPLMTGISRELMKVNDHDDIARWWEVMDRTTGEPVPTADWHYDAASESVVIDTPAAYHEYTVSFLAYLIWDPVHMYNSVINDWKDVEHQIPFDVRQPKTHAYTMRRLREYLESHPYVNVVRFTTFFHLFTLVFDELRREKYVDWYGYSASVSPYILEQFEKEVGYKFRPEFIIDQGYYNNQYRVPTKEYKDFQAFQRREVAGLMKEMTDIVHEYGKEAMMFLGDHWIGCEPFMPEFQQSGVDAIVGSVGNGSTLRLISDIPGVKYTEGRFLPYFFPDTFHAALGAGEEVLQHLVVGPPRLLRHLAVAHGCHDKAVLHRQLIDPDGRKQRRVGIQRLRHAGGAPLSILAVRAHPVTEAVHQLLYQNILFQEIVLTFLFDLHALYSDSSIAYSSCRINKKDGEKANHSLQPATFYGRMMLVI